MKIGTYIDYPQAFPIATATDITLGMALRDYFAGQALAVAMSGWSEYDNLAKQCYAIADAMLKEREQ